MGKKAHDIITPHTRGSRPQVRRKRRGLRGMIGVEEKTKGEIQKWLSYL